MSATITQIGANVRVKAVPRGIASLDIINSELIVTYNDATSESAGFIGETLPENAIVSRANGALVQSRVTGEQLVGRS
jgi:hypothetical protein